MDNDITVHMPGGELRIEIATDGRIHMTGPVEGTFEGRFHTDRRRKSEIQSPKSETSTNDRKLKIRNGSRRLATGIMVFDFEFVLDFEIHASDLSAVQVPEFGYA